MKKFLMDLNYTAEIIWTSQNAELVSLHLFATKRILKYEVVSIIAERGKFQVIKTWTENFV